MVAWGKHRSSALHYELNSAKDTEENYIISDVMMMQCNVMMKQCDVMMMY